jgi:hypothetical protein
MGTAGCALESARSLRTLMMGMIGVFVLGCGMALGLFLRALRLLLLLPGHRLLALLRGLGLALRLFLLMAGHGLFALLGSLGLALRLLLRALRLLLLLPGHGLLALLGGWAWRCAIMAWC